MNVGMLLIPVSVVLVLAAVVVALKAPRLDGMQPRVRLYFEPRDLWIGAYRDTAKRLLYVCPLPCLVVLIRLGPPCPAKPSLEGGGTDA